MAGIVIGPVAARTVATVGAVPPTDSADPAATGKPTGTPLYNLVSGSYPTIMIFAGAVVVMAVVAGRLRASKKPKELSLEERLARLVPERRPDQLGLDRGASARASASGSAEDRGPRAGAGVDRRPARGELASAGAALDAVVRDTEELAERLAAAMDGRAARLEQLIRDADERIRRLDQARIGAEQRLIEPRPSPGQGTTSAWNAAPLAAAASSARAPLGSLEADQADPVQRQVFALADEGLHAVEIARRLGQPTGQVELMLALRGR